MSWRYENKRREKNWVCPSTLLAPVVSVLSRRLSLLCDAASASAQLFLSPPFYLFLSAPPLSSLLLFPTHFLPHWRCLWESCLESSESRVCFIADAINLCIAKRCPALLRRCWICHQEEVKPWIFWKGLFSRLWTLASRGEDRDAPRLWTKECFDSDRYHFMPL